MESRIRRVAWESYPLHEGTSEEDAQFWTSVNEWWGQAREVDRYYVCGDGKAQDATAFHHMLLPSYALYALERREASTDQWVPVGHFYASTDKAIVETRWRQVSEALEPSQLLWIGLLLICPQERRRGLCTAAFRHVQDELVPAHHRRYVILNVYEVNEAARRAYEKLGFQRMGHEIKPVPEGLDLRSLGLSAGDPSPLLYYALDCSPS